MRRNLVLNAQFTNNSRCLLGCKLVELVEVILGNVRRAYGIRVLRVDAPETVMVAHLLACAVEEEDRFVCGRTFVIDETPDLRLLAGLELLGLVDHHLFHLPGR